MSTQRLQHVGYGGCRFAPQRSAKAALEIPRYIIVSFALETWLMSALRVHLSSHHA